MDNKMSKFELWKLKIRRKGFNILSSYPLTPEECFPEDISRDLELGKLKIVRSREEDDK